MTQRGNNKAPLRGLLGRLGGLRFRLVHPVNGKPDNIGLRAKAEGDQFVQLAAHGGRYADGDNLLLGVCGGGHGLFPPGDGAPCLIDSSTFRTFGCKNFNMMHAVAIRGDERQINRQRESEHLLLVFTFIGGNAPNSAACIELPLAYWTVKPPVIGAVGGRLGIHNGAGVISQINHCCVSFSRKVKPPCGGLDTVYLPKSRLVNFYRFLIAAGDLYAPVLSAKVQSLLDKIVTSMIGVGDTVASFDNGIAHNEIAITVCGFVIPKLICPLDRLFHRCVYLSLGQHLSFLSSAFLIAFRDSIVYQVVYNVKGLNLKVLWWHERHD
jgi:hypothetical protein